MESEATSGMRVRFRRTGENGVVKATKTETCPLTVVLDDGTEIRCKADDLDEVVTLDVANYRDVVVEIEKRLDDVRELGGKFFKQIEGEQVDTLTVTISCLAVAICILKRSGMPSDTVVDVLGSFGAAVTLLSDRADKDLSSTGKEASDGNP